MSMACQAGTGCLTVASSIGGANQFFCKQVQSDDVFLADSSSGCLSSELPHVVSLD